MDTRNSNASMEYTMVTFLLVFIFLTGFTEVLSLCIRHTLSNKLKRERQRQRERERERKGRRESGMERDIDR